MLLKGNYRRKIGMYSWNGKKTEKTIANIVEKLQKAYHSVTQYYGDNVIYHYKTKSRAIKNLW